MVMHSTALERGQDTSGFHPCLSPFRVNIVMGQF